MDISKYLEITTDIVTGLPYKDKIQSFKADVVTGYIVIKFKHNLTRANREVVYYHLTTNYKDIVKTSLFHNDRELFIEIGAKRKIGNQK